MRITWALVAALLLVPAAVAQTDSFTGVQLEADDPPAAGSGASTQIPVTVTLGCFGVVLGAGGQDVTVAASGEVPAWLNVTAQTVSFSAQDCADAGNLEAAKDANVTVSLAPDAPGLETASIDLVASYEGADGEAVTSNDEPVEVSVNYTPGHSVSPGSQTFRVTEVPHSFNVTLEVTANAETMVMFRDQTFDGPGTVSGLQAKTFDVAAGETSATRMVTFEPTSDDWQNVTLSFEHFSHCIGDEPLCDGAETGITPVTWRFTNEMADAGGNGGDGEDSPGAGTALVALALLGAVFVALRRRA